MSPTQIIDGEEVTSVSTPGSGQVVKTTRRVGAAAVPDEHPQKAYHQKKAIFRMYQIIWYLLGIVEALLGFRLLLKLLGANPSSGFANLIYGFSEPFVGPFRGLFGTPVIEGGYVIEWITLVAMIVYLVLGYGLVQLFQLVKPTTPEEVETTVDNQ